MTICREPTMHFQRGRIFPPSCLSCYSREENFSETLYSCQDPVSKMSPHYLVGPEGTVVQLVELEDTALMEERQEGEVSVLFCLENGKFSSQQLAVAGALFRTIQEQLRMRYGLPFLLDNEHIHWIGQAPDEVSFSHVLSQSAPYPWLVGKEGAGERKQGEKKKKFFCPAPFHSADMPRCFQLPTRNFSKEKLLEEPDSECQIPSPCPEDGVAPENYAVAKPEPVFSKETEGKNDFRPLRSRAELAPLYRYREGVYQLRRLRRMGYRNARLLPFNGRYRIVFDAHSDPRRSEEMADALQKDGFSVLITFSRPMER